MMRGRPPVMREPTDAERRAAQWLIDMRGQATMDDVRDAMGWETWCSLFNAGWTMVLNANPCLTPQGERVFGVRRNAA